MHLEIVNPLSLEDLDLLKVRTNLFTDEPDGLLAALAWELDGGSCNLLLVWETLDASVHWTHDTMWPLLASGKLADLEAEPPVAVEPIETFIRR